MKKQISLLMAAAICLCLCACASGSTYTETEAGIINGMVSDSGDAYIPSPDGTVETITGEVKTVQQTRDRKHTVILEEDGTLSVLSEGTRTVVAEEVDSFSSLTNDAFLFTQKKEVDASEASVPAATEAAPAAPAAADDESKDTVSVDIRSRYVFDGGGIYTMPVTTSCRLSNEGGTLLYSAAVKNTKKYALHMVKAGETESTILATTSNQISVAGVNHDGSVYAWAEGDQNECTVYLFANGEKQKAITGEKFNSTGYSLQFNKQEDFAILTSTNDTSMALWTADGGIVKAKLPNSRYGVAYTTRGSLATYPDVEAGTVYIQTDGDSNTRNLYAVNTDGMREKIANSITDVDIRFGNLYYIKDDGSLFTAKLSGSTLSDEHKIADSVCAFTVSPDGTAIVYARDVASDNIGALYYYSAGAERPVRIASESFCWAYHWSYSGYWTYYLPAVFSNDGKTIYYFTDGSQIEDSYNYTTTLMQYTIAKGDSVRIGSDILPYVYSNNVGGYPETNRLWYYKYTSYDEEGQDVLCDLMYWNGESASVLANDIIK
ncbi:MAG: WD40 repeat domain-containing protein [Candidatus Faecousia sp.]|nr:WD40 repeat domain-containing protein [Candidatus Faecousia sp.]